MKKALTAAVLFAWRAAAQEAVFMEAATQPAAGAGYLRTQLVYRDLGAVGGRSAADQVQIKARYSHGLRYNISLNADVAWTLLDSERSSLRQGLEDPRAFVKWRVLQNDSGPVNTVRGSLIGGAELPAGAERFSSDSLDLFAGGVVTAIRGRHGFNADAVYQMNTGSGTDGDDRLTYDASWLYRLSPPRWRAETKASLYTVLEINAQRFEDGDHEMLLSPGLLYEARTWAAEIAVRTPLLEQMDRRRPEDFGVAAGYRRLF